MSIFSGRNPIPAPSIKLPSETLQLSSVVLGDELEIEGEGGDCLKIVSKITKDGILEKDTHHLYLKREAVVLYYTIATNKDIATNMDVDKVWNIGVVYGSGSTRETVEYPLQSQQDAFRFQRLVTGYTPHTRFRPVAAYALEQHFAPGRQATEIKSTGEVQLWCVPRPKLRSQDAPMSPLQATRTRSSTGSRAQSILSLESTLSGATVLQADKGKFVALTKARIPPLLLLFAKRDMNNGQKSFNIMRVDSEFHFLPILSLPCQPVDISEQSLI